MPPTTFLILRCPPKAGLEGPKTAVPALRSLSAAIVFGLLCLGSSFAQTFTPKDETPDMFPDHPGREETVGFCTACHGFRLVAAQGMNRQQWDDTLDFMTEKHKMPAIEGADRKQVLDYLEAAFPPHAPAQQGGFKNPFAQ